MQVDDGYSMVTVRVGFIVRASQALGSLTWDRVLERRFVVAENIIQRTAKGSMLLDSSAR